MSFLPSDIILVTGGNGHVAQHVIQQLLSHPSAPTVRTSVRSSTSASKLSAAFPSAITSTALQISIIPDITLPDAFSSALTGVTHIAHIASPLIVGAQNVENDVLKPAIDGTTGILKSALKCKTLKSVVVTSSFAAVFDAMRGWRKGYVYGPRDWNPISYEEVANPDLDLSRWPETWRAFITYMASKKLAEKAAWDLYEAKKPEWNLSVVCPTYIGGPTVLKLEGEGDLSFSNGLLWKTTTMGEMPELDFPNWVDVRDVARVHILALQCREASGQRFILTSSKEGITYSDLATIGRRHFPEMKQSDEKQEVDHYSIDTSNLRILGFGEFINTEEMVVDIVQQVLKAKK